MRIVYGSNEYVRFPVTATENGDPVDPTGATVDVAFVAAGSSAALVWNEAAWETIDGRHFVRVLIGPDGVNLDRGLYTVLARIDLPPEMPVIPARGTLRVA